MEDQRLRTLPFFDDVWGVDRTFNNHPVGPVNCPPRINVNLVENANNYTITADVPGVPKSNITARYDNARDTVTIVTSVDSERTREDQNTGRVHLSERFFSSSARTVRLPHGCVDYNTLSATYDNGVLTITVDKLSEDQRKQTNGIININ